MRVTRRAGTDSGLHSLTHQMPVGIFETDPAGSCTFVNERWCELTGLDREAALADGWAKALHPEDREAVLAEWTAATTEGREFQSEYRFLRPDGSCVWVVGSAAALHSPDGTVTGFLGSCADITAHRRLQIDRALQEETFSQAFDHAPIGIALVSPEGRWLRVNRALCDLTGYAEGELLGKTFQDITHPDDLEKDLEHVERMLAGEISTYQMEKRYFRADGHTIWVLLSVSLISDADGVPLHFISQIQDITERKTFERDLAHQADHDGLTGLMNRRRFSLELRKELARARRHGHSAALLFIDLDDFKGINDSLGHKVGDDLIRAVGSALAARVRGSDVLARLGGDEFGVLLTETDLDGARIVANELSTAIREAQLRIGERTVRITASIGMTPLDAHGSEDDLLIAADLAMYEAKQAGRDRIAVHGTSTARRGAEGERVAWPDRIRDAFSNDGFVLHYQPILDLHAGSVTTYEALIRMRGPNEELIPPGSFLDVADRYGMAPSIDRWVASKAIETIANGGISPLARVAINISARTLNHPEILDELERELARTDVAPSRLIFEITETAAIEHVANAKRFAARLTSLGCSLALDDFGTGFSSFYYLKHLPCQYLKIDGEFIRNLRASPNDRLLVQSMVDIARGMGKLTIAEFVGDEETIAILKELGVDYAQGFHIGKPAAVAAVHAADRVTSA